MTDVESAERMLIRALAALKRVEALAAEFEENPWSDWDAGSVAKEIRAALKEEE